MSVLKQPSIKTLPSNIVLKYLELYKTIGLSEEIIKEFDTSYIKYHDETVNDDIFYLYRLVVKDSKISDSKLRQFIERKGNITPKNKDEKLAYNLRNIFDKIEKNSKFLMTTTELYDLAVLVYKNVSIESNEYKKATKEINYHVELDKILESFNLLKNDEVEYIYKCLAFFIDFLKLSPFKYENELIAFISLYCLILESDIKALRYSSLFKELYTRRVELDKLITQGFYLYQNELSNILGLLELFIDIFLKAYKDIDLIKRNTYFDKEISKSDNIRAIIYKMDEIFSKDEIIRRCPTVSMTTIDRTLKALQEEGKIKAFGTGRCAKWVRLEVSNDFDLDNYVENN